MSVTKKKREKPCKPRGVNSRGEHGGGGRVRLSPIAKVLLGGGAYASFKPIGSVRETGAES